MTTLPCPACGQTIAVQVPPGTRVQCPLCSQIVTVPVENPPAGAGPGRLAALNTVGNPYSAGFGAHGMPLPNSGMAVASLVCGIIGVLGVCMGGLGAILGLVAIGLGIGAVSQIKKTPDRVRGKGMAIAGITTGTASVILAPLLLIFVFAPYMGQFVSSLNQEECKIHLQQVAFALESYAQSDPDGMFPDNIKRLIDGGQITAMDLTCPSDTSGARSYYYVPGYSLKSKPSQILLYEHPDIHADEDNEFTESGGSVIYLDGRVVFVTGKKYKDLINNIKTPDDKRFAPHEE